MAEETVETGAGGPAAGGGPRGTVESVELSRARQSAARRVAESKATIPHLYLSAEAPARGRTLEPTLVRACALALREHPDLNGAYRDGRLERYSRVNVGVAVAADGPLWPTVFDADAKDAAAIAAELGELKLRAEQGAITRAELSGATFTVSAVAGGATALVWPTIPPGQAAALAAGAVAEDGTAGLVLACDERLADARAAGVFLDRIVALLGDRAAL